MSLTLVFKDEVKITLLDGLLTNSFSFDEVIEKSKQIKDEEYTKETFLKEVGFDKWEEAKEAIPQYADVGRLKAFTLKRKKELPSDFQVRVHKRFVNLLSACLSISSKFYLLVEMHLKIFCCYNFSHFAPKLSEPRKGKFRLMRKYYILEYQL